jgi:hypothetical protein
MPIFEIICLANSWKHGGRCIAGFKTDGSGWLRPVSGKFDGSLYEEHYTLANGQEPALFNILRIECTHARPEAHQPENWAIADRKWQLIGSATIEQLNNLLTQEFKKATNSPMLLGNDLDRLEWDYLQQNPLQSSLCLIRPQTIQWKITTKAHSNQRKFRAIFSLQQVQYDLAITDPIWRNQLDLLPDGEYTSENIIKILELQNFNPQRFLLTISLSEPFQSSEREPMYCFKLIAAVINAENVRTVLKLKSQ